MQYQVPQFIEIEDKIFGPLTFKQFVYLVGGGGMCFLIYRLLPGFIAFFIILPIAAFSVALAFYKLNNKPFLETVISAVKFFFTHKLYIWKKEKKPIKTNTISPNTATSKLYVPKLSKSKLRELTWNLDINETIPEAKEYVDQETVHQDAKKANNAYNPYK